MSDKLEQPASEVIPTINFFELPPVKENEKTEGYWVGTLPGCPRYNLTAGGVSFPRFSDPPTGTDPDSMQTSRAWARGTIVYLTDAQVDAVRRNIKDKIVRMLGNRGQGMIYAASHPLFTREVGDQPLAMFLYMVRLDEQMAGIRMSPKGGYPMSMYEQAGGVAKMTLPARPKVSAPDIAPEIEDLDKPIERQHVPPQLKGSGKK